MPNNRINSDHIDWFRASAPYIHTHRGSTFVIFFGGETVEYAGFAHLIHDIALLGSLGVRLVLIHGARPQIEKQLQRLDLNSEFSGDLRITPATTMPGVEQAVGQVRMIIEAQLSMGLPNTAMAGAAVRVVSGNFITAQPYGIRDGIDFCQTGNIRNVDAEAIISQLEQNNVVLVSPIGYSPTGETFNLRAEDVATETAIALQADKLIFIVDDDSVTDKAGNLLQQLNLSQAEQWQEKQKMHSSHGELIQSRLNNATHACHNGVARAHMINGNIDGALLLELYSRDGVGTLISADNYEGIRTATINDIGGIMELISPLEEQGFLLRRSREQLELDIHNFTIIERDNMIIACAALFLFPEEKAAELACLAVHPDYQQQGRGNDLMEHIEWQSRKNHITELFTLTTQTTHWFLERGFNEVAIENLPIKKQSLYNYQRKSKILHNSLK